MLDLTKTFSNLRPFDKTDWQAFGGCDKFVIDGNEYEPMICEKEFGQLCIVADGAGVSVIFLDDAEPGMMQHFLRADAMDALAVANRLAGMEKIDRDALGDGFRLV